SLSSVRPSSPPVTSVALLRALAAVAESSDSRDSGRASAIACSNSARSSLVVLRRVTAKCPEQIVSAGVHKDVQQISSRPPVFPHACRSRRKDRPAPDLESRRPYLERLTGSEASV